MISSLDFFITNSRINAVYAIGYLIKNKEMKIKPQLKKHLIDTLIKIQRETKANAQLKRAAIIALSNFD